MLINQNIIECELEYSKCFSDINENKSIIRFRDNELKDMYYHNFTYIKDIIDDNKLSSIINEEIKYRISEGSNFCNILLNKDINTSIISSLNYKPTVSKNGYYLFNIENLERLNRVEGSIVKQTVTKEMVEDVLYCDLQHDEETLGKDFCTNRCYRRGKVYISECGVNSYICYHNGNIIGNCDLFIHNGIAKIEDFAVIPKYQRKGYGTTILKELIEIALKEKCNTIYLLTDEDDTAKEMYEKIGFEKIGERTDLFFRL